MKKFFKLSLALFILGVLFVVGLYINLKAELPSVETLKTVQLQTPMQIFSSDGELISQFGEKRRIPLTLDEIPELMLQAFLATEDNRFYLHFGVDPIGMMRAISGQLTGQNKGGASTITMQVARNFFLTREQTYIRKIKEIFISLHIESLLTKDEILTLYLNKIELGHRAFGVGAAAQVYYGKEVQDLTLAQIAVIAGLPKAPSTLNPIRSPERAKARRSVVLQRMLTAGYITQEDYEIANNAPMTGKKHGAEITLDAPYIAEMAHQEMIDRYGKEDAYTRGFKVYTTVSAQMQRAAQHAVIDNIHNYDLRHGYRGIIKSLWQEEPLESSENGTNTQTESREVAQPLLGNSSQELLRPSQQEILDELSKYKDYQNLTSAAVLNVFDKSIEVLTKSGELLFINWDGLSWARPYIDDDRQGDAPSTASDIVSAGDLVWIRALGDDNYQLSQIPEASSALVSLSPDDGAIKAAVGGYSFKLSQFNRVNQAERQVGSNIKPFIYSAALENGFTLASLVNDAPINQWDRSSGIAWRPKNSPPRYDGPTRVRIALAQSKNVISVRLLRSVGLGKIIDHLSGFGFAPDELPRNESLALGSASSTPLDVASGFATFANGGFLIKPYLIERIEDSFGNTINQANPEIACLSCLQDSYLAQNQITDTADTDEPNTTPKQPIAEQVISSENAFLVTQMLNSAIWETNDGFGSWWRGTGWRARTLDRRDIAGKTGTTNDAKDAWFSGFSRHLVTTTWIGFDDHQRKLGKTRRNANLGKNQITGSEAGAKSAQPAWVAFMNVALSDYPVVPFEQPDNIVSVRIDRASGKLSRKTDKSSQFEYFVAGTEPTEYATDEISLDTLDNEELEPEELF